MKSEVYYVIYQNEDSMGVYGPYSKEQVLKAINEGWYGNIPVLNELPTFYDGNLEKQGIVIIRGDVVVPQAVEVVTKYEL